MSARSTLALPTSSVTLVMKVCFFALLARTPFMALLVTMLVSPTTVLASLLMVRLAQLAMPCTALSSTPMVSTNVVVVERPSMKTRSSVAVKPSGIVNASLVRNAVLSWIFLGMRLFIIILIVAIALQPFLIKSKYSYASSLSFLLSTTGLLIYPCLP